jgi:phage gp36-like protein
LAYAQVSELREFLGDAFAAVEDPALGGYLDYASAEIDTRLSPHFAELPFEPVPALIGRMCLYRAAAEVLVVYYGRAGAGTEDGRAERFREDYETLLTLLLRDPALLGVELGPRRGSVAIFHDDPDRPDLSRFGRFPGEEDPW